MGISSFKFMSRDSAPGVQVIETDNSQMPAAADAIGAVIIGRASKGIGMVPIQVKSWEQFVANFGDTVAGYGGGDVYRKGNDMQSPMYGTYAAKAYLKANVAPLTYIRLLGEEGSALDSGDDPQAGWKTDNLLTAGTGTRGGAIGLFVAPSASAESHTNVNFAFTGSNSFQLAAVWYLDGGSVALKGTLHGTGSTDGGTVTAASTIIESDSNGRFKVVISGSNGRGETIAFNFDDTSEDFARKKFNTNPQLRVGGNFYSTISERDYWLGETYEQELRDGSLTSGNLVGVIAGVQLTGSTDNETPANMLGQAALKAGSTARTSWIIGQDQGSATSFKYEDAQQLFRVLDRGHGEWTQRNLKVSIEKLKQSQTTSDPYGTFSLVLRKLSDTDNDMQVVERFDNLNLNPRSPNYIGRQIGDKYWKWDTTTYTTPRLVAVGERPNTSKYIRMDINADIDAGAGGLETLLPWGYYGPPKYSDSTFSGSYAQAISGSNTLANKFIIVDGYLPSSGLKAVAQRVLSGGFGTACSVTASFKFPSVRIRNSASDGGLSEPTNAYFGVQTTRTATSTRHDASCADVHRMLYKGFGDNPVGSSITGIDSYAYVFTLDDIVNSSVASSGSNYFHRSGSRVDGTSYSATGSNTYKSLLDAGYNKFTAPFWGAFDGFNIRVPDPMYNNGIGVSTEAGSSIFYTWNKAIAQTRQAEEIDMNMLLAPGLTNEGLNNKINEVCTLRGDSLGIIDLPNVYIPSHEVYYADKSSRIGTTPNAVANNRSAGAPQNSSYGCTFYPWVQTRDANSGQLVWVPPSVAMAGVIASSEKRTKLWFAPAGFNRGGLTDGAANIPVVAVSERLTSDQRDTLYAAGINPIASFPGSGIVVFGQKTLQGASSALDRINVRRLMNYVKKSIALLANNVIFEQNVEATWNNFRGLVEPFLSNILIQHGITNYALSVQEEADVPTELLAVTGQTDQDWLIDQNILYAKIKIQPARAIEFIALDFVVTRTGVGFND
jgi:hypothetical protein